MNVLTWLHFIFFLFELVFLFLNTLMPCTEISIVNKQSAIKILIYSLRMSAGFRKVLREVASRGRHVERVKNFFRNMYICAKLFRNLTPFYFLCYSRLCFLSFPMTCYAFALYLACLKLLHKTCYIFCPKILYPCYDWLIFILSALLFLRGSIKNEAIR
jgi:hypothetical protein